MIALICVAAALFGVVVERAACGWGCWRARVPAGDADAWANGELRRCS